MRGESAHKEALQSYAKRTQVLGAKLKLMTDCGAAATTPLPPPHLLSHSLSPSLPFSFAIPPPLSRCISAGCLPHGSSMMRAWQIKANHTSYSCAAPFPFPLPAPPSNAAPNLLRNVSLLYASLEVARAWSVECGRRS